MICTGVSTAAIAMPTRNILRAGSNCGLRSNCSAEMPATRNAAVSPEAIIMCVSRYGKLGLKMTAHQSAACSWPSMISNPCGVCIQELSARIQNAEADVPIATRNADTVCIHPGTRSRPNSITPRKVASRKNAVSTS